ncbi:MAG: hypothetical protein ACE5QW_05630 [Thermoplasmata archaeon]
MDEEISFKRITRLYREESSKKSLTPLEPDFFERLNGYLEGLESKAREEQAKGGQSKAATLLLDEYQKASKKRDQVFRLRLRKIASLAASKSSGASVDTEPLTRPELAMFEGIVGLIAAAKSDIYGGEHVEPATERPQKVAPTTPSRNVIIRILEDIPAFAGVEGNYDLKKEDVASLPRKVAEILVKKGKAKEIEIQ